MKISRKSKIGQTVAHQENRIKILKTGKTQIFFPIILRIKKCFTGKTAVLGAGSDKVVQVAAGIESQSGTVADVKKTALPFIIDDADNRSGKVIEVLQLFTLVQAVEAQLAAGGFNRFAGTVNNLMRAGIFKVVNNGFADNPGANLA